MALNFIYGVSGSGKTKYVFDNLIKNSAQKICLIVPEQFTHQAERMVLKTTGSIHKNSVDVLSFERIGVRVFSECGGLTAKKLTNTGKGIIISKILDKCDLSFYKNSKNTQGFAQLCMNTISEFKKYDITTNDLESVSQNTENKILKSKLEDFCKLYHAYSNELGSNYVDFEDVLDKIYNTMDSSCLFNNSIVIFDKFSSFIPQEINIIKKIISMADEVYITLTTNNLVCNEITKTSLFSPVVITCDKLLKVCNNENLPIGQKIFLSQNIKHSNSKMFNVLNKALCENKFGIGKDINNEILLFYDKNPYTEVENTAKEILRLCREEGYRYNQIGVISANLSEYSPLIESTFEKYNIAYFIDEKKSSLSHPIINFVLGAIDIYLEKYSYESVFSYLHSGYTNLSDRQINILENYALATNLNKTAWYNDEKWNYQLKAYSNNANLSKKFTDELLIARNTFIFNIKSFHNDIKGRKKASVMAKSLYLYLDTMNFFDRITEMIQDFEKKGDNKNAKQYLSCMECLADTLEEIVLHIGDDIITPEQFRNQLATAFSMQNQGYVPYNSDNVIIGNTDRTVSNDIRALFVLGAVDGFFPTPKKADFIFTDIERDKLLEKGLELSETSKTKAFYNKFLIYNCIMTPSERLYISFPVQDSASKALRPAFLFSTLKKIFPDINITMRSEYEAEIDKVTICNATIENLIVAINENNKDAIWADVYKYYLKNDVDVANKIKNFFDYNPLFDKISPSLIEKVFGDEIFTSISKLQTYRSCKFMYFLKYILKLDEKEIFDMNAADVGTFVHMVFENICKKIEEDKSDFVSVEDEYIKEKIDLYIKEEIEKLSQNSADDCKRQAFVIERLREALFSCFDVLKFHIIKSSFIPLGYEIEFGLDDKTNFEIETDNGKKVKIMGIIDRADKYETAEGTFIRIVDYKTGNKTFSLSNIFYGFDVQLMVYLSALSDSEKDFKKAGALYFKFEDYILKEDSRTQIDKAVDKMQNALKLKGLILDNKDVISAYDNISANRAKKANEKRFDTLSNHIKRGIKSLCNELFEGQFNITPCIAKDSDPCSYCIYSSICKFDANNPIYTSENLATLKDDEVWEKLEGMEDVD
ncbi:MAG: hypothetical protein E7404_08860 [Ruminococcaceae bacterium]|nr:hypothetical protein [Oscillospiraceae bacterium]